jgi:hypothetical protein
MIINNISINMLFTPLYDICDTPPSSLMDSIASPKVNNGKKQSWGTLSGSQHFGGKRVCWSFGMGLGKLTSTSITYTDLHKPNKLVSA